MLRLFNECNMQLMARSEDKQYDLAIVDPPYGIGFSDYERVAMGVKVQKRFTSKGKKKWDNAVPSDQYFKELFRVSKNQIIFGGNYFEYLTGMPSPNLKTIEQFKAYIEMSSSKWLFWHKQNPVPNFADGELAWLSFDKNYQFDFKYYGNLQGNTSADKKIHPTQKPYQLYRYCLNTFGKPGDEILDTHLGSGSHALACHDYGFNLTACEIDPDIFSDSQKRITNHIKQENLFL